MLGHAPLHHASYPTQLRQSWKPASQPYFGANSAIRRRRRPCFVLEPTGGGAFPPPPLVPPLQPRHYPCLAGSSQQPAARGQRVPSCSAAAPSHTSASTTHEAECCLAASPLRHVQMPATSSSGSDVVAKAPEARASSVACLQAADAVDSDRCNGNSRAAADESATQLQPPPLPNMPQQSLAALPRAAAAALSSSSRGSSISGQAARDLDELEQPPEVGLLPDVALTPGKSSGSSGSGSPIKKLSKPRSTAEGVAAAAAAVVSSAGVATADPDVRSSWARLMRWSRNLRSKEISSGVAARDRVSKVVVFGGGSFGTAMGVALARQKEDLKVSLLLRDPYLCRDINEQHRNTRYLKDYTLPPNVTATTSAAEAIAGAQYAIHAVPVQHSRAFLQSVKEVLPPTLPLISVSKGVEVSTGKLMADVITSSLGRKQPAVFLSGPSFAKEVMDNRPTAVVAASKDRALARQVQALFASPSMRVNVSDDVVGVEICGALKNVLAIAAGIVEGLELGHNAMAALISQGCSEIWWLAEKMHAKPTTISGLSGMGDIMLTCYGSLSRNRTVGVRLGRGERLEDIQASSSQVAEGVATAGVVVSLARKYRVQLPVLTAVAQVLDGHISAREAVAEIMNLPQIEER